MEALRAVMLFCLALTIFIWSAWLAFYGKPAILEATECCERNKAIMEYHNVTMEHHNVEIKIYQEQVMRLISSNERLAQEVAELKSKQPVKWRVK
jgi:hypothetical protein